MCNFTVSYQGTAQALVATLKQRIEARGGQFNGDEKSGSFNVPIPLGHVSGTYTISAAEAGSVDIAVTITHQPAFASCDQIKEVVEQQLSQAAQPAQGQPQKK